MKKIIQINKQTTIVHMRSAYGRKRCRRRRKNRRRRRARYSSAYEVVTGAIFQKSDSDPHIYFRSIGVLPAASVMIQNDTVSEMKVVIKMRSEEITQTVGQSQQVTLILPSITKLTIICTGDPVTVCRGCYRIRFRRVS